MRCFAVGLILGIEVLQGHVADREVHTIVSGSIPHTKVQSWEPRAVIVGVASGTHIFPNDRFFCRPLALIIWEAERVLIPPLLCPGSSDSVSLHHFRQDPLLRAGERCRLCWCVD